MVPRCFRQRTKYGSLSDQVHTIEADVGTVEGTRRIVAEAHERFDGLHILVNNAAATLLQKPVQEMTVEEWDQCINASLRSVFLLSKWSGSLMRECGAGPSSI